MAESGSNLYRRKEIGNERRERTRLRLLTAAAQVLAEHGERKATIEDFVRSAGVARGTFYNYYKTVDEIQDDLWEHIGHQPFQQIQTLCAPILAPEERFVAKARMVLNTAIHKKAWGWIIYSLSRADGNVNEELLAYPRPELEQGQQSGGFKFQNLTSANDMAVGTLRSALHAILLEQQPADYPESICVLLLKALGVDTDTAEDLVSRPLPVIPETAE